MINDATVTTADVMASNGVVHVIDTVLLPPVLASKNIVQLAEGVPALSDLVKAVVAAELVGTLSGLGPWTVFAPTNAAFDKLPAGTLEHLLEPENKGQLTGILTYHVVSGKVLAANLKNLEKVTTVEGGDVEVRIAGGKVMINDATVTTADVMASNGVVHVIDTVLLPPVLASKNIVQLAEGVPALSTLVKAVVAADLAGTLSGVGPFTVFAPTNAAFDKLPAGTLKHLLEPKHKKQLAGILTYHVVSGKVLAADLKNGETVKTLEGADLKVHIAEGKVMINDAEVTTADVIASNGVVHIINGVLSLPKASEVYMVV